MSPSNLPRLFILEDSLVAATEMSISTDVWVNNHSRANDIVLYWDSPAYRDPLDLRSSLLFSSRYQPSSHPSKFSALDDLFLFLGITVDGVQSHIQTCLAKQEVIVSDFISSSLFSDLPFYAYKGILVGSSIVQSILSELPDSHFLDNLLPIRDVILSKVYQICGALELLYVLQDRCQIYSIVLSEHVYHSSSIIEFSHQRNIYLPRLHDSIHPNTPLSYVSCVGQRSDWHSRFAYIYSASQPNLTSTQVRIGREFIENLARRKTSINSAESDSSSQIITRYIKDRLAIPVNFVTTAQYLCNRVSEKAFIFYLDTYSDAPYSLGNSGYVSSVSFIIDIVKIASRCNVQMPDIILRLHPNMLLPLSNVTEHRKLLFDKDIHVILRLVQSISRYTSRIFLMNPGESPVKLATLPSVLHITHHGTIGLELMHLQAPVLYTLVAPYAGLGISRIESQTRKHLSMLISAHYEKLFDYQFYQVNMNILWSYVFTWQYSPCSLRYKTRSSINALQNKSVSLHSMLTAVSSGKRIHDIIDNSIISAYHSLALLELNANI
jgi:hypothetical protein